MFCISCLLFSSWKWLRISIHLLRSGCLPVLPLFRMQICHLLFSTSLFIMLTFPPSILPLFVMSELVMNFTDFLGFFGDKECTVMQQNVINCSALGHPGNQIQCFFGVVRVLGRMYLKKPFTIIPQDLKGSLEKLVCLVPIHMEKSVYCLSLTLFPVTSHSWEGRKPPDIRLDITTHVMQSVQRKPVLSWLENCW